MEKVESDLKVADAVGGDWYILLPLMEQRFDEIFTALRLGVFASSPMARLGILSRICSYK